MTNSKMLIGSIILILTLGVILNIFVSPFIDNATIQSDGILNSTISMIDSSYGFDFFTLNIELNPFAWFDSVQDFVIEQLTLMTYIPSEILSIIMTMFILSLILYLIAVFRGN